MALTLITQELFENVGVINSGSLGNFIEIQYGTWYKRAVGPKTSAISLPEGWSADNHHIAGAELNGFEGKFYIPSGAAQSKGFIFDWWFIKDKNSATISGHYHKIHKLYTGSYTSVFNLGERESGKLISKPSTAYSATSAAVVNGLNQWYGIGLAWEILTTNTYRIVIYVKEIGSAMTVVYDSSTDLSSTPATDYLYNNIQTSKFTAIEIANSQQGSFYEWNSRCGGISLYSFTGNIDEIEYDSNLIEPPTTPNNWYLDTVNGDDNNTGLAGSPWKTAQKLQDEMQFSGIISTNDGYDNGDTVYITSSEANQLDISATTRTLTVAPGTRDDSFTVDSSGINIDPASGLNYIYVKASVTLDTGDMSQTDVGTYPNVWQTTDTDRYAVLWEDNKWMTHLSRNSYADDAALLAAMNTTPGSFWNNNGSGNPYSGVLYFHPFGSTDPTADGKTYERSHTAKNNGVRLNGAIDIGAADIHIKGIYIKRTTQREYTNGDVGTQGYGIQLPVNSSGDNLIENCFISHYGGHACGAVSSSTTIGTSIFRDIIAEQGPPDPISSFNPFVSFSATPTSGNNYRFTHYWIRCTYNARNIGVIGSADGATIKSYDAFLQHGKNAWKDIYIQNCDFSSGKINTSPNVENGVHITDTKMRSSAIAKGDYNRCETTQGGIGGSWDDNNIVVRNCKIIHDGTLTTDANNRIAGYFDMQYCTIDFSGSNSTGTSYSDTPALFFVHSNNNLDTLIFKNNIVKFPSSSNFALFKFLHSSDTLDIDNNIYYQINNAFVADFDATGVSNNKTWIQWQALGYDTDSLHTDPKIASDYTLLDNSPAIGRGDKDYNVTDLTGKTFDVRDDIGAFEFFPFVVITTALQTQNLGSNNIAVKTATDGRLIFSVSLPSVEGSIWSQVDEKIFIGGIPISLAFNGSVYAIMVIFETGVESSLASFVEFGGKFALGVENNGYVLKVDAESPNPIAETSTTWRGMPLGLTSDNKMIMVERNNFSGEYGVAMLGGMPLRVKRIGNDWYLSVY